MNRKFGKRGGRRGAFGGKGQIQNKKGYLPEELMSHYRRVLESLRQFENEENIDQLGHSKSEFLNNVVSSLAEELVQVSQNQTVSSIVESVIAAASPANLRTLYVSATTDLPTTFLDRFASHVLEALVLRLPEFFDAGSPGADADADADRSQEEDEEEDVAQDKVEESFQSMCGFVDAQFEVLVTHAYGSHVLRAFLEALSGVSVARELKRSQKSGHGSHSKRDSPQWTHKQEPPQMFKALFDKYSKQLFRVCDYEVHLKDPLFSLLIQAVLMILHHTDPALCQAHCQTIVQKAVDSCCPSEDSMESIPDMARDTAGSHLLEVIFSLGGGDLMRQTFGSLLQGKLLYFAVHPAANHVLQRFIASLHDKDLMEKMFDELSKCLEDVLAVGYFGLVTSLAEGCRRLRVKQDDFVMTLMDAFHCKEPQERQKSLIRLIASFTAYEVFFSLEEGKDRPDEDAEKRMLKGPVQLQGSRLLQELLQFQRPSHAALGLLDLRPQELQLLCCDPAGSHVLDAFFASPTVLEKNRDILLRKLKGLLVDVACTKNGSRCLESVWKNLGATQRTGVAKELADSERLRNDRFGHFLHRNLQLGLFATNRKRWQEHQGALVKRKRMVKELLHKTVSEPPVKKRKAEECDDSRQRDSHTGDSITAMFLKQKQQHDARLASAAQPQASSEGAGGTGPPSSSSPGPAETGGGSQRKKKKQKKKKQKKDATEPVKTPPVEQSAREGYESESSEKSQQHRRKEERGSGGKVVKKKKAKTPEKASHTKLSQGEETVLDDVVEKAGKRRGSHIEGETGSEKKGKEKKKARKSEKAPHLRLSEREETVVGEGGKVGKRRGSHVEGETGSEKKGKKKKKAKMSNCGEDE